MNIFNNISSWWQGLFRRRRLSVRSIRNNSEVWHTHVSPVNVFITIVLSIVMIFTVVLSLIAYTPILTILPGYKSEALRSREQIINNIIKIDSMEHIIGEMMLYTDNVALIMSGGTPIVRENLSIDSITLNKILVLPNRADSLLRAQMEGDGRYNIKAANFGHETTMVAPSDGIITRHYDTTEGKYGVGIAASAEGRVVAVQRGLVVMAHWTPDQNYIIAIMHSNNTMSIYRDVKSCVVTRGSSVKAGEVIGHNRDDSSFEFELWVEGKAIDPEQYITF